MPSYLWSTLSVAAVLIVWQIASTWLVDAMFLPAPVAVVQGALQMLRDGTLTHSVLISMMRILSGWPSAFRPSPAIWSTRSSTSSASFRQSRW